MIRIQIEKSDEQHMNSIIINYPGDRFLSGVITPPPSGFILTSGTPVVLLKSGENRNILVYLFELKSFNSLIQAAVRVMLTE